MIRRITHYLVGAISRTTDSLIRANRIVHCLFSALVGVMGAAITYGISALLFSYSPYPLMSIRCFLIGVFVSIALLVIYVER